MTSYKVDFAVTYEVHDAEDENEALERATQALMDDLQRPTSMKDLLGVNIEEL